MGAVTTVMKIKLVVSTAVLAAILGLAGYLNAQGAYGYPSYDYSNSPTLQNPEIDVSPPMSYSNPPPISYLNPPPTSNFNPPPGFGFHSAPGPVFAPSGPASPLRTFRQRHDLGRKNVAAKGADSSGSLAN
jgi:hypothetical protein